MIIFALKFFASLLEFFIFRDSIKKRKVFHSIIFTRSFSFAKKSAFNFSPEIFRKGKTNKQTAQRDGKDVANLLPKNVIEENGKKNDILEKEKDLKFSIHE